MNEVLALQEEHDLLLPDDFNFQYAQVAYAAGRTETAIAELNEYLVAAGREGEFYREALELLESAEVRLDREEAERRRARRRAEAERRRVARWPPGHVFRDCETCPEMVVLPGSAIALGRHEVTLGEYRASASANRDGAGRRCVSLSDGDYSWQNPSVCVLAEPDDASPVPPADSRGIGGRGRGFSAWMLSGPYRPRGHVPGRHLRLQRLGSLGPARKRVGVDVALRGRRLWPSLVARRLLARPARVPRSQHACPQTHRLSPGRRRFPRRKDAGVARCPS